MPERATAMTDEEILTPGLLIFPHGGEISVHSHDRDRMGDAAQVYYAIQQPGAEADDWTLVRTPLAMFIAAVRAAGGVRAPEHRIDPDKPDGG
jgi:hypothetical protein